VSKSRKTEDGRPKTEASLRRIALRRFALRRISPSPHRPSPVRRIAPLKVKNHNFKQAPRVTQIYLIFKYAYKSDKINFKRIR